MSVERSMSVMIAGLIAATRTVRRFQEDRSVSRNTLLELVDLARMGGSARNGQPLKYQIITENSLRAALFPLLGWAGYLPDWKGPAPGERPPAYVLCLLERKWLKGPESEAHFDLGIASQNLLLGAAALGIFGCRIGSFSSKIHDVVDLDPGCKVLLVLALGYPAEQVVLEEVGADGDVRYWRDTEQVHHVPKRRLADILVPAESKARV